MRRLLSIAAPLILAVSANRPILAANVALSSGEPDPNCSELRLWLRADAGVRDSAGHGPSDPQFTGIVTAWKDQSNRHFDLGAPPERAPSYVSRQPGAGNRPTVAFGGGRMLARPNDTLHDRVNSTTLLVLQVQRSRDWGNIIFCVGDPGGKRESLSFERANEVDGGQGYVRWWTAAQNGEINLDDPLEIAADGRFAIAVVRSAGASSTVEVQDGWGDALGANRAMVAADQSAISDQCGRGYCLGGQKFDQPQYGYDGQIAEVLVYNRSLTPTERRVLTSYLRRKYELDVLDALSPVDTMLMQAEDFDGPWQINPRWDSTATMCQGQRHITSSGPHNNDGLKRTVLISRPGNYAIWVRAFGIDREGGLRISVGGKPLTVTHAQGSSAPTWQRAGTLDLPQGETEIVIRGEGLGRKECDAVLVCPAATPLAGVEDICALAKRLRQTPNRGQLAAVFDDGRRIEGNLVSGWRGSGLRIAREGAARPKVQCLLLDCPMPDAASLPDALLEFHNGDRMRGAICGYVAASTQPGKSVGAQVQVLPSQDLGKATEKPISVEIDWLRRIVFDASGQPRQCPPRSLVCRDGRVIAFRALRFNGEGLSLLTDQGLVRLGYRELAEVAMPPIDSWEAYYRQLAEIDANGDAGIVRLETGQGMVFTVSSTRIKAFREEAEPVASTCLVEPVWSRTPIPVAWSAIRIFWRAPATVVPLSWFAPQGVAQRGALGGSWKWHADRNVAGGELLSGGNRFLWGFGVHAPNELTFRLPICARAFRSGLGIDAAVGDCGCVVAKVCINQASGTPAFRSQPILGSRTVTSTGEIALAGGNAAARDLLLAVEDSGDAPGPNADPLDIGDHFDWLEPTLLLDPAKLHAAVAKYRRESR